MGEIEEQLIALCFYLNEQVNEYNGLIKYNELESISSGSQYFDSTGEKILYFYKGVIKNHPFIDGNKRTASSLIIHYFPYVSDDQLYDMTINLASGKDLDIHSISTILGISLKDDIVILD